MEIDSVRNVIKTAEEHFHKENAEFGEDDGRSDIARSELNPTTLKPFFNELDEIVNVDGND